MKALALHGFLGDGMDCAFLPARMPDTIAGFSLDYPDLPGHGPAPDPAPADFAGWVDWVRERIADAGEPVHLLGYSMGGRLALAAALAEIGSGRVASLMLLSASPGLAREEDRVLRRAADADLATRLENDGLEPFLESWYRQPLFAPLVDVVGLEEMVATRSRGNAGALAAALRTGGAGMMPDLRADLPRLDVPVLVVAGELDDKYMQLGREIANTAPHGRFASRPGVGHALLHEPDAYAAELWYAFLQEVLNDEGDSP